MTGSSSDTKWQSVIYFSSQKTATLVMTPFQCMTENNINVPNFPLNSSFMWKVSDPYKENSILIMIYLVFSVAKSRPLWGVHFKCNWTLENFTWILSMVVLSFLRLHLHHILLTNQSKLYIRIDFPYEISVMKFQLPKRVKHKNNIKTN